MKTKPQNNDLGGPTPLYNSGKITREEFEEEVDERVAEINDDISGRAVGNGLEEFLDEEIKENELRTKLLKELCDCEKK